MSPLAIVLLVIAVTFAQPDRVPYCGENDFWVKPCKLGCQPTCRRPVRPCICEEKCTPGCQCIWGYVRNELNGKCIRFRDCPKYFM